LSRCKNGIKTEYTRGLDFLIQANALLQKGISWGVSKRHLATFFPSFFPSSPDAFDASMQLWPVPTGQALA
jgi:hypothetical protein